MKINHKTGEARLTKKEIDAVLNLERDYSILKRSITLFRDYIFEKGMVEDFKVWGEEWRNKQEEKEGIAKVEMEKQEVEKESLTEM